MPGFKYIFASSATRRIAPDLRCGFLADQANLNAPRHRCNWVTNLRIFAVLALLFGATLPAGAQGQGALSVESGKRLVVLNSAQPLTEPKALSGNALVNPPTAARKEYVLVYVAPIVTADTTDTISYTLGGEVKTTQITVTARSEPPTLISDDIYFDSFRALFVLFIIAVLLESGLSLVFNWRPFIETFDSRGVKTLIAFAFAYIFVETFNMDITTRLVNLYSDTDYAVNFGGKFITALVIAGGSSGVNNLLLAFGFRSVKRQDEVQPRPKPEEAWISVKLARDKAVGPVTVLIGAENGVPTVAGTIVGTSKGNRGLRYFLRDKGRFPSAGGYPLTPDTEHVVSLAGVDENGEKVTSSSWGPYKLSKGAIVDLELPL